MQIEGPCLRGCLVNVGDTWCFEVIGGFYGVESCFYWVDGCCWTIGDAVMQNIPWLHESRRIRCLRM